MKKNKLKFKKSTAAYLITITLPMLKLETKFIFCFPPFDWKRNNDFKSSVNIRFILVNS